MMCTCATMTRAQYQEEQPQVVNLSTGRTHLYYKGKQKNVDVHRFIMVAELHVVYELQSAALFSLSVIGSM